MTNKPERTIFPALIGVMKELSEKGISKDQENKFDNYKFRGIDDVLNAMSPILSKFGLVMVPSTASCNVQQVSTSQGKLTNHATVFVDYTFYDQYGDSITHRAVGEAMDRGDKSVNKALSAAFKYFLFQAFCIPLQGQDADSESHVIDAAPQQQAMRDDARIVPQAPTQTDMSGLPPNTVVAPGGAVQQIPAPATNQPAQHPVEQTIVPADTSSVNISDESAAEEMTTAMIQIAKNMHSGSLKELGEFWVINKQTIDAIDNGFPNQYARLKAAFTEIKQSLQQPQEAIS